MVKFSIPAKKENLEDALDLIQATLEKFKFKGEKLEKSLYACQEELKFLIKHATEDAVIQIKMKKKYSTATIKMSAAGTKYSDFDQNDKILKNDKSPKGHAVQSLIKEAYAGNITYSHKNGVNQVKIFIGKKERLRAIQSLVSFGLSIVFCLLMDLLLSESAAIWCITYIFSPIQTLFLNALKLITAPAVFFSVMTAVTKFGSVSDIGTIGKRSVAGHVVSGFLATVIGAAMFHIFKPTSGFEGDLSWLVNQSQANSQSLLDMISNGIPDNIVEPFLNVDALQLLMFAILSGIALIKAGKEAPILEDITSALHKFFKTLVDIVTTIIPVAVFFITTLMIFTFGFVSLVGTLRIFLLVTLGFVVLILFSIIAVGIFGKMNPITFIRKMLPHMKKVFWDGSSISAIPATMKLCQEKFGVSKKVESFTVPFGAIADIDGNCLYLAMASLFLTQACGIDPSSSNVIAAIVMIMILSIGSAITPGSAMLALIVIMGQMGVSLIAVCLILGVNAFLEIFLAVSNNVREVASTLIIARKEKLINMDVYNDLTK